MTCVVSVITVSITAPHSSYNTPFLSPQILSDRYSLDLSPASHHPSKNFSPRIPKQYIFCLVRSSWYSNIINLSWQSDPTQSHWKSFFTTAKSEFNIKRQAEIKDERREEKHPFFFPLRPQNLHFIPLILLALPELLQVFAPHPSTPTFNSSVLAQNLLPTTFSRN